MHSITHMRRVSTAMNQTLTRRERHERIVAALAAYGFEVVATATGWRVMRVEVG